MLILHLQLYTKLLCNFFKWFKKKWLLLYSQYITWEKHFFLYSGQHQQESFSHVYIAFNKFERDCKRCKPLPFWMTLPICRQQNMRWVANSLLVGKSILRDWGQTNSNAIYFRWMTGWSGDPFSNNILWFGFSTRRVATTTQRNNWKRPNSHE